VNQNLNLQWNPRRISDDGCLVIDFKSYMTYTNQKLDALHDAAIEEIKSMRWSEIAGPEGRELRWSTGSIHSVQWGYTGVSGKPKVPIQSGPIQMAQLSHSGGSTAQKLRCAQYHGYHYRKQLKRASSMYPNFRLSNFGLCKLT